VYRQANLNKIGGSEIKRTYLICDDDVKLLCENIHTIKMNIEAILDAGKEAGIAVI
jgi:hypothetical protein